MWLDPVNSGCRRFSYRSRRTPHHDEIKSGEFAALQQKVDGLKAMGVIMEREGISETETFEMLKTMSQHTNVKPRDVAVKLARGPQPEGPEES